MGRQLAEQEEAASLWRDRASALQAQLDDAERQAGDAKAMLRQLEGAAETRDRRIQELRHAMADVLSGQDEQHAQEVERLRAELGAIGAERSVQRERALQLEQQLAAAEDAHAAVLSRAGEAATQLCAAMLQAADALSGAVQGSASVEEGGDAPQAWSPSDALQSLHDALAFLCTQPPGGDGDSDGDLAPQLHAAAEAAVGAWGSALQLCQQAAADRGMLATCADDACADVHAVSRSLAQHMQPHAAPGARNVGELLPHVPGDACQPGALSAAVEQLQLVASQALLRQVQRSSASGTRL